MHKHFCAFCQQYFDCETPFCEGLNPMACDECFNHPTQLVQLTDKLKRVAEYAKERGQTT